MKKVLAAVLAAAMSLSMASVAFATFDGKLQGGTTSGTSGKNYTVIDDTLSKKVFNISDQGAETVYLYNYNSEGVKLYFDLGGYKFSDIDVHVASGDVKPKKERLDDNNMAIIITPNFGLKDTKSDWSVDVEVDDDFVFTIKGKGAYSSVQEVYSGAKLRVTEAKKDSPIGVDSDADDGCFFDFSEVLEDTTRIRCDEYVDLYFKGNYDTKVENLRVKRDVPDEVKEYFDDEDVDCYDFIAKPKFAKSVEVIIDADADSIIYEYDKSSGDLTRIDASRSSDGWKFSTKVLGTYIVTEEEYDEGNTKEPAEEPTDEPTDSTDKSNPGTGANDMVGAAAALAIVSLVAAGAVAFKKASK